MSLGGVAVDKGRELFRCSSCGGGFANRGQAEANKDIQNSWKFNWNSWWLMKLFLFSKLLNRLSTVVDLIEVN